MSTFQMMLAQLDKTDPELANEIREDERQRAKEWDIEHGPLSKLTETLIADLAIKGWSKEYLICSEKGGFEYCPKLDTVTKWGQIIQFSKVTDPTWSKLEPFLRLK